MASEWIARSQRGQEYIKHPAMSEDELIVPFKLAMND